MPIHTKQAQAGLQAKTQDIPHNRYRVEGVPRYAPGIPHFQPRTLSQKFTPKILKKYYHLKSKCLYSGMNYANTVN